MTAEQLMRSRFSAFAVGDVAHLIRTWHPDTRPPRLLLDASRQWTRLEVIATSGGGLLDNEGTVEFRARSTSGEQHETSRFERLDGTWVYVAGMP